jgi:hypothetical protein
MPDDVEAIAVLRDRRKHPRVDHKFGVRFRPLTDGEAYAQLGDIQKNNAKAGPEMNQGSTQDISLGGICLRGEKGMLAESLAPGSFLDLLIDMAGQPVHCLGTVVWFKGSVEHGFYAGVAFMGLDEESLSKVEATIATVLKGSSI